MALNALSSQCMSDSETRDFLRTLKVPSGSTDRSSELVPFAGRLCSTLAEHVSEMKSLFPESSPSDGTISASSATLPSESPLLTGNTVLEVISEEFSLFCDLLLSKDDSFDDILIKCDFVLLLKSTIITCLDLLEQPKSKSNCPHADKTTLLITILDNAWNCSANSLHSSHQSLHPIVESTFSDVPQLYSLLERTCPLSSPPSSSHLEMIVNLTANLSHFVPRMLEENLVQRVINTTKPMAVPTTHGDFHKYLVWSINNLIWKHEDITEDEEERKRIRKMQFERVLKPAKQYLRFILLRDEFILTEDSDKKDMPDRITYLLELTLLLERELFEDGEIVETGREEWEVGWLVEKIHEKELGKRLKMIREDDVRMKKDEKLRWKKRVERRREAGHSDAMEGWVMRRDDRTRSEIVEYIEDVSEESGMNVRF
ncbi:hypothetical protein BLNAU_22632 [Blattamonas nauphoetae]|uniref:Uncharacterized protein n=1 Tax=Blattamonas nauphoetae TaxID=2049346 RepID=A0ABQ9WSH7_9EUKA|nr:hypothetical protein BLNAU_22632 [Blattamonas nauphoetae]